MKTIKVFEFCKTTSLFYNVPGEILNPRNTWENPELLMKTLRCSKRIP
jgi:ATP-dependent phosphoenolpyruvate carboxykinase